MPYENSTSGKSAIVETVSGDVRLIERCATEGCGGQVTHRYEAGGVGSYFCSGCTEKMRRLSASEASHD